MDRDCSIMVYIMYLWILTKVFWVVFSFLTRRRTILSGQVAISSPWISGTAKFPGNQLSFFLQQYFWCYLPVCTFLTLDIPCPFFSRKITIIMRFLYRRDTLYGKWSIKTILHVSSIIMVITELFKKSVAYNYFLSFIKLLISVRIQ